MQFVGKHVVCLVLVFLVFLARAQRASNQLRDVDVHELARQNKITKQILEAFLQKKLGLHKSNIRPPSIHDILPVTMKHKGEERDFNETEVLDQELEEVPDDGLQSVESEQIDSIYAEGRSKKYPTPPFEGELDNSYRKI